MLAALMTSPHFLVSAAMKAATSAGEPTFALALSLDRVSSISFDAVIALITALSLPMTSGGVPAGAATAVHDGPRSSGDPAPLPGRTLAKRGGRGAATNRNEPAV